MTRLAIAFLQVLAVAFASGKGYRSLGRIDLSANGFRCPSEGFFPDPFDCRTFYRCDDWNSNVFFRDFGEPLLAAFQFRCSEGTVFDPEFNVCNHPRETARRECGGRGFSRSAADSNDQYPFSYSALRNGEETNQYPYEYGNQMRRGHRAGIKRTWSAITHTRYRDAEEAEKATRPINIRNRETIPKKRRTASDIRKKARVALRNKDPDRTSRGIRNREDIPVKLIHPNLDREVKDIPNSRVVILARVTDHRTIRRKDTPDSNHSKADTQDKSPSKADILDNNLNKADTLTSSLNRVDILANSHNRVDTPASSLNRVDILDNNLNKADTLTSSLNRVDILANSHNRVDTPASSLNRVDILANSLNRVDILANSLNRVDTPASSLNRVDTPASSLNRVDILANSLNRVDILANSLNRVDTPASSLNRVDTPASSLNRVDILANSLNRVDTPASSLNRVDILANSLNRVDILANSLNRVDTPASSLNRVDILANSHNRVDILANSLNRVDTPANNLNRADTPANSLNRADILANNLNRADTPANSLNRADTPANHPSKADIPASSLNKGDILGNSPRMADIRDKKNGKGGYMRYDFVCGPGTVWDQESTTCNHPWAVQRKDCSAAMTTEASAGPTRPQEQTTPGQSWNQETTSTQSTSSSSFQTSSTPPSSSSENQSQQTTSSPSQTTPTQQTSSQQGQKEQTSQMTTPASKPSTMRPQTQEPPATPAGSRPCQPEKNMTIKCEKAGFYPVPGNCKKFYRCVDWDGDKGMRFSVYYFECGEGTIWDPALETCNHEESVYPPRDCSGQESKPGQSNQTTTEKNTGMTDATESTTAAEDQTDATSPEDQKPTDAATEAPSSTDQAEQTTSPSDSAEETMTTPGQENPESTNPPEETTDNEDNQTEPTESPGQQPDGQNQTNPDCPTLGEDQVAFVCPTGFKRHPKDCNLFYQCTISKEGDVNVMTLSCKNETVYDERKIQCLPPDETDPCPSKGGRVRRWVEEEETSAVPIPTSKSLCPKEGHFPYDCQRFFRCQKDKKGRMQGYLYQCPEKFFFSDASRRCEKSSKHDKCSKSLPYLSPANLKWMASKVPIAYFDVR
ncbi:UNVERIFIED_CONTAM: hypothetical protein PYX00_000364 [Menopon gallinae]|uniref:Chitin-binding type-2 domain-containing protein n=1 Tax=Menopon gallinae TaxID=328185 RepID=A0AAW2I8U2_9NEOP